MFDMRQCKPGDRLISRQGLILEYIAYHPDWHYPHEVRYPNIPPYGPDSRGTRCHDGFVFQKDRREEDQDIIGFAE